MNYEYRIFTSIPEAYILDGILKLHQAIFGSSDNLLHKMSSKSQLLVIAALEGEEVIGYKIGYPIDKEIFYSWLGGVNSDYRKQGIASELMNKQHHYLIANGFNLVQTKTMNKWRSMLILNIKSGFDVIETYTDKQGLYKIVLEKHLSSYNTI